MYVGKHRESGDEGIVWGLFVKALFFPRGAAERQIAHNYYHRKTGTRYLAAIGTRSERRATRLPRTVENSTVHDGSRQVAKRSQQSRDSRETTPVQAYIYHSHQNPRPQPVNVYPLVEGHRTIEDDQTIGAGAEWELGGWGCKVRLSTRREPIESEFTAGEVSVRTRGVGHNRTRCDFYTLLDNYYYSCRSTG
jgi:hypothetical protein